jgi:hypothetical protein
MRCTIVLEFDNGDGSVVKRVEVMRFHRPTEDQTPGDVGLSLAEGKSFAQLCAAGVRCRADRTVLRVA